MARWIDADLIENIDLIPYKRGSENINAIIANVAIVGAKQVVDKIPTADVVPVTHAHWKWELADNGWADTICSNCGHVWNMDVHVSLDYDYCPYCGAKMDEVSK